MLLVLVLLLRKRLEYKTCMNPPRAFAEGASAEGRCTKTRTTWENAQRGIITQVYDRTNYLQIHFSLSVLGW